jgi:HEAT repeat protein
MKRTQRYQTGMRTLIALVACVALIFWAWRRVGESSDPARAEARAIQAGALRALSSPKASERIAAIQELDRLQLADAALAVRPLTALLADSDDDVRLASIQALGRLGASAAKAGSDLEGIRFAIAALIKLLKELPPGIRVAAADSIASISSAQRGRGTRAPDAVIAALTEALRDPEAKVRGAALVALATASSGTAAPPKALAAMFTDDSAENRRRIVEVLWRYYPSGLDSWIPTLLRMAEHDEDQEVRQSCFGALQWIKPPQVTPAVIPVLVAALASPDQPLRENVATLLSRFGADAEPAIPALLGALTAPIDEKTAGPDQAPDWETASALGSIAPGSASAGQVITALAEVVRSGPRIRQGPAAWALGQFGPAAAPAIPDLIRMAREAGPNHGGIDIVQHAARALGLIAPETPAADEAVTVLVPVLNSKSADSRAAALKSLLQFGPKASVAVARIRELRKDRDAEVRQLAAKAIDALEKESKP